jgi:hypothetical protein
MKHKLFHTLVLSGVALVEGCATAPHNAPAAAPAPTHAGHSHTASPAEAATPSEPATRSEVAASERPPTPEAVRAMVADARSCADVGWATTKSASSVQKSRVVHNDQVYWCLPEDLNRSPRCCAAVPGQTSPP